MSTSAFNKIIGKIDPSFIFALVISTLLWISISLSEEVSRTISIPFAPIPDTGFAILSNYPERINIVIQATGYEFSNVNQKDPVFLRFDSSDPKLISNGDIEELIKDQLDIPSSQIVRINFRDILFEFDTLVSKTFAITDSLIHYEPASGTLITKTISISSDSFQLSGPKASLEPISSWTPFILELGNISGNKSGTIELSPPLDGNIKISPSKLSYNVELEKAIEKKINIPIVVENSTSLKYEIIPQSVSAKFLVGLSRFDSLNDQDFSVTASIQDSSYRVPVIFNSMPKNIKGLSFEPDSINVLLSKE